MSNRKDFIGPTIGKRKTVSVPEGPVADLLTAKTTKGMAAAKRLLSGEPPEKVEGTPVKSPLQLGPPIKLDESQKVQKPKEPQKQKPVAPDGVNPNVLLGNTHVGSYQTLLANDKLAKPVIKAWKE